MSQNDRSPPEPRELTPQESLAAMQRASDAFYVAAQRVECHAFIEFTGLMNEFIGVCKAAEAQGIDWRHANTHSKQQLPFQSYQVAYINEKLECIFQGLSFGSMKEDSSAPKRAMSQQVEPLGE